ncbi:MAG: hypothetical protein PHH62_05545 [Endomicrobiaceae bacterium]|nr:hypothetical protein [Endomicrobiaceae bacterium]
MSTNFIMNDNLNILTGLPKNKEDDLKVCQEFSNTIGKKVICGSSTMKMYCRELKIIPEINIIKTDNLPIVKYKIEGIDLAAEGIITLNKCCQVLSGNQTDNQEVNQLAQLLNSSTSIKFIVGTADNNEQETYLKANLLARREIIEKIACIFSNKTSITLI